MPPVETQITYLKQTHMKKKQIDVTDIEILNILTEHAELNNKELANKIGLSEGPTLVRVQEALGTRYNQIVQTEDGRLYYSQDGYGDKPPWNLDTRSEYQVD